MSFDFGDELIPPPMSLSAPELGSEPLDLGNLRHAISSSELLHERAMLRFYQAMQAREEEEDAKQNSTQDRKQSLIPKIQINSQDEADIRTELEREHSLRRRKSLSATGQQRALWAKKRHSLRGTNDIMEVVEQKFGKVPDLSKTQLTRQRSESEEEEERALDNVRDSQRKITTQHSTERRKVSVVHEQEWEEEDYEESLSESEMETESEDERLRNQRVRPMPYFDEDHEDTYHSQMRVVSQSTSHTEEPFEILTKRKEPPSPDFVPKPILKKIDNENVNEEMAARQQAKEQRNTIRTRTHSPMPSFNRTGGEKARSAKRERSISLTASELEEEDEEEEPIQHKKVNGVKKETKPLSDERKNSLIQLLTSGTSNAKRERSVSLTTEEVATTPRERSVSITGYAGSIQDEPEKSLSPVASDKNISAAAALSCFAAASIIIPKELLRRKADEEAKVVIDHYGDILKNYSTLKKKQGSKETVESKYDSDEVENPLYAVMQKAQKPAPVEPEPVQEKPTPIEKVTPKLQKAPSDEYEPTLEEVIAAKPSSTVYDSKVLTAKKNGNKPQPDPKTKPHETENALAKVEGRTLSPKRQEQPKNATKTERVRTPSSSRSSSKTRKKDRSASKSPHRLENLSSVRSKKKSPSPAENPPSSQSHSTSPETPARRRPMMKEIMTQTSIGLESNASGPGPGRDVHRQEELIAKAEIKVRSTVDYITDLAMFIVACWLYLHHKELFAIPVLVFMVYRQVAAEVPRWIPKWIKKRFKKKKKN